MPAAGQLNTLINIKKATDTRPADHGGEVVTTYTPYHRRVPAQRMDVSGGSTRRGLQVEETVQIVFVIHFIKDVKTHWRVEIIEDGEDPQEMEIVTILQKDDRRQWMELHCADVME
ncbi:MAG: head-tail adaptor protein [Planctomycetota bacterium]